MKRYTTISSLGVDVIDYSIPVVKFSVSLVDKRGFIPLSEQVRGIDSNIHQLDNNNYDYVDGKDTGIVNTKGRGRKRDIAEVYTDYVSEVDSAKSVILEANKKAEIQKRIDSVLATPQVATPQVDSSVVSADSAST
ncbi:hypothetical protein [Capybara microvirus Cap1_SP_106]|nr:hypothetical protein [Capybara microvirus Cap1_SP_106]